MLAQDPQHASTSAVDSVPLGRVIWRGWRAYNDLAASYQRTMLLSVIYLIVLGPSGVVARLAGQQLMRSSRSGPSTWTPRPKADTTLSALRRQF